MKQHYSVALLVETSSSYGRQILRGIQRFIHQNESQHWIAVIEERDLNSGIPNWIQDWAGDGIISRHASDEIRKEILELDIAFVDLGDRQESGLFAKVISDDAAIGRMAGEHLRERGLSHFAFCGFQNEAWSDRRGSGYQEYLRSIGIEKVHTHFVQWCDQDAKGRDVSEVSLTQWLQQLPKPIGIMTCNDVCGKHLIDCCYKAGISVPESVAVTGVDNDELLCDFCQAPLSSVIPNAEAIGFHSAELLAKMLADQSLRSSIETVTISPLGVVARRSSDMVAVEDEDLANALRYIRSHANQGMSVAQLVEHCGVSRSTIERKMRSVIGRTPQQEILRVRLRHACTLLAGSDLAIDVIASKCGYAHPEYLHVVFKRELGVTPGEYRYASRNN
ncbi:transcriptional regulator, AraC family [Neorhodopirellula lusitana]|uniref:Transcriptional regulator, AraC family n=1 Tax=Neorhodopirellula lusitana TaxID=445327 RepID=A0ABY1PW32_9BACT|nr:DNA-binding transcriptional regulator [Neorhodopirellula lusitana]SMP47215.1 transcriptional regulator, AraC family [Neorhodopirellula lusitana]